MQAIPEYLRPYIVEQDPSKYTPIDHASWRYILKIAQSFFAEHAHPLYLNGLRETGISTERIPLISEMDRKLAAFGWRAVAVSGFIPPAVFMEFLSRGILPIACDMRKLENIAYTPAPDIVHEAAGHAPIIADPEYAAYLRHYGELAEKAIFSNQDLDVYNAVRILSDTKEDPYSTPTAIESAQRRLDEASAAVDHVTEATQLGRMGWWTIEYGLLGDVSNSSLPPKIYGAGLLSSVSESYNCLGTTVRKVPLTVDCVDVTYDITKPQPQLYVAQDCKALVQVLDDFAARMAFRRGGVESLEKARKATTPTTTVLESGIQIGGTLERYELDERGDPCFLKYSGPVQLCFANQELPDQGPAHHPQGFSSPIGRVRLPQGASRAPTTAELTAADLEILGFDPSAESERVGRMEFESGIRLEGVLRGTLERGGHKIILTFGECTVRGRKGETLFDPAWGVFDLACGARAISVYGGAADRSRYLAATGGFKQEPGKQKSNLTPQNRALNGLYARVRAAREGTRPQEATGELAQVHAELETSHPADWLLRFELLELDARYELKSPWRETVIQRLETAAAVSQDRRDLIRRGLELLK
jgi:phenylalanine-4-hydroxylase